MFHICRQCLDLAFQTISVRHVIARADGRCEYCLVRQDDGAESHQVDHVIAIKHGGGETICEDLALACAIRDSNKGSDLASIDLVERVIVPLFSPRVQNWKDHFSA